MPITANLSATGAFSVADWTPPPIEQLDFTRDCRLAAEFFSSWFNQLVAKGPNKEDKSAPFLLPFSNEEASFFVAETVDTKTTEAYFRNALPPEMQNIPSYGQVLEWELALRNNFSQALPALAQLNPPPNTSRVEWFVNITYQAPYFTRVIHDPGLACQPETCKSFQQFDRLIDINGPGIYVVYWAQYLCMFVASAVVVTELFLTRSRVRRKCGPVYHSAYRCFRRTLNSIISGAAVFFAFAPLALYLEAKDKGPHFFPPTDQNTSLLISSLSLIITFWSWRVNRCFSAIDLVKGGSPVSSTLSQLPLICFIVAVPFAGALEFIRNATAKSKNATGLDAYDFDFLGMIICKGSEYYVKEWEASQRPGGEKIYGLFTTTRLAISTIPYAAARLLWDDLVIRSTILRLLPWKRFNRYYAPIVNDALASTNLAWLDNNAELDRTVEAIYNDPRTSVHIWYLGWFEMMMAAAYSTFAMVDYHPRRTQKVEWNGAGEQWNLGQLLALVTLIPTFIELLVSFGRLSFTLN